ncbi:MAG: MATE family efflux transporter [candidate division WS1 bacterium]|nr:MATE family efflux transporter [candidate division WS1 bacterium]
MSASPPSRYGRDLTVGSLPRQMIAFALPMLASVVLLMAYSFVNAIWVGRYLGKTALAAVTISFPIFMVLVALGGGLTLAANILVAQHVGAGRRGGLGRIVDTSVVLTGSVALVFFVIGEVFAESLMRLMQTPPDVLAPATSYMRIFMLSQPFGFGMFLMRNLLQGLGDSTTPLYVQSGSIGLNIVLDPVLMFGWLGLPRLGLQGTAWASTIAQAAALIVLLLYLHRQHNPVAPRWRRLQVHLPTLWTLLRIGVPASVQQSLVSIAMLCVIGLVNGFGVTAIAAFGAATRLEQLVLVPAMVFGLAISTVSGQNLGANKLHRVHGTFRWGIVLSGSATVLASAITLLAPQLLLKMFITDAEVIREGMTYLQVVAPFYVFLALMFVGNGIINGAGDTLATTMIAVISQLVVRIPLAVLLIRVLHSVTGVWIAIAVSFVISMLASFAYYRSGRWQRARVAAAPAVTQGD